MSAGTTVTIREVADRAEVSIGTVSRVLNGHLNVAPEFRDRVLKAATELGYRPSPQVAKRRTRHDGANRAAGRSTTAAKLGFLLTLPHLPPQKDLMAPFWAEILHGAEREATAHGASVSYRSVPEAPASSTDFRRELKRMDLEAVLLVGVAPADMVTATRDAGLPVVLVDHRLPSLRVDAVVSDYLHAGLLATEHLIDAGHRCIAFIGGPLVAGSHVRNTIPTIEDRAIGYRTACAYAELPAGPELAESCDLTPQGGYDAVHRLLERGTEFSAIFCAGDRLASGVLRALHERGLDVPGDVSVVSVGDEYGSEQTMPPLSTVRVPKEVMGAMAVRRLLEISGDRRTNPVTIMAPVELVPRASVAPPSR